jgi:hypothetical protein
VAEREHLEQRIAALERQLGAAPARPDANVVPPAARPPKGAPQAKRGRGRRS